MEGKNSGTTGGNALPPGQGEDKRRLRMVGLLQRLDVAFYDDEQHVHHDE